MRGVDFVVILFFWCHNSGTYPKLTIFANYSILDVPQGYKYAIVTINALLYFAIYNSSWHIIVRLLISAIILSNSFTESRISFRVTLVLGRIKC